MAVRANAAPAAHQRRTKTLSPAVRAADNNCDNPDLKRLKAGGPDSEEGQNEDTADCQASKVFPLDDPNQKSKYIGQFAPEVSSFPCYI